MSIIIPDSIDPTGTVDVCDALEAFIAAQPDGTTIEAQPGAVYRAERSVRVDGRTGITLTGDGATLLRTQHLPLRAVQKRVSGFIFRKTTNCALLGWRVHGRKQPASSVPPRFQAEHAVQLVATVGTVLEDITARHTCGDGVYVGSFGGSLRSTPSRDTVIRRFDHEDGGRHGVCLTGADGVLLTGCRVVNVDHHPFHKERRVRADVIVNVIDDGTNLWGLRSL